MLFMIQSILMSVNTDDLIEALNIFWKGMLAIMLVLGIVILATYLMNRIANRKDKLPPSEDTDSGDN